MKWHITFTTVLFTILFLDSTSGRHSHSHKNRNHRDENNHPPSAEDQRLALEHSARVSDTCTCQDPKVHVVHVSDHYPGRYFLPHCTVLHRCGKHSGCCASDSLRCTVAEKQKVVLHFFSVKMLDNGEAEKKIEKLTFTNHTKCGCEPVDPNFPTRSLVYS